MEQNKDKANLGEPTGQSLHQASRTTCLLVRKNFVNKVAKVMEHSELYLRCSSQDYFIKFCESEVSPQQLKPYIDQSITVDMEIRFGMWDHCSDDPAYAQSRTGPYVVIKSIVQ